MVGKQKVLVNKENSFIHATYTWVGSLQRVKILDWKTEACFDTGYFYSSGAQLTIASISSLVKWGENSTYLYRVQDGNTSPMIPGAITQLHQCEHSQRQCINKQAWLCANKLYLWTMEFEFIIIFTGGTYQDWSQTTLDHNLTIEAIVRTW
jgi:hypothetical protein